MIEFFGAPGVMLGDFAQVALLMAAGAGLAALYPPRRSPVARAAWALLAVALLTLALAWVSSHLSPAWANRYLAVALPPLLLAGAAGLAHAGRLGVAGLVVAAALAAGDTARDDKSNVRDVAEAVAPSLRPGDLVVSTWPEQVPVLGYYLPPGLRYATLTGAQRDTGVTDWRDGVERLRASSPEAGPAAAARRSAPRSAAGAGDADHLRHRPLAGAVDRARPPALGRVAPVRLQRPPLRDQRGRARAADGDAPERRAGDGLRQDERLSWGRAGRAGASGSAAGSSSSKHAPGRSP